MIDNIRIWNRGISEEEVIENIYNQSIDIDNISNPNFGNGLILSCNFEHPTRPRELFNHFYYSGASGYDKNVSEIKLGDMPSQTVCSNYSLMVNKIGDYAVGASNSYL